MASPVNTTTGIIYLVGWSGSISGGSAVLSGDLTVGAANAVIWSGESMIKSPSDGLLTLLNNAGTSFTTLQFGGTTSSFPAFRRSGTTIDVITADAGGYANLNCNDYTSQAAAITAGSGTGVTVVSGGLVRNVVYKVTVLSTQFIAASTTADITLATLPAKTQIQGIYADSTTTFAGTAGTLAFTVGSTAGGTDFLVSFDVKTATIQRGLVDGDLGTGINRANAVQGGKVFSWTANTIVSARLTSGSGNLGTGAATNLTQGSITFYIVTTRLP